MSSVHSLNVGEVKMTEVPHIGEWKAVTPFADIGKSRGINRESDCLNLNPNSATSSC